MADRAVRVLHVVNRLTDNGGLGYEVAFRFDHRIGGLGDPLGISRIRISEGVSRRRFDAIMSGAHPRLHHALRRP